MEKAISSISPVSRYSRFLVVAHAVEANLLDLLGIVGQLLAVRGEGPEELDARLPALWSKVRPIRYPLVIALTLCAIVNLPFVLKLGPDLGDDYGSALGIGYVVWWLSFGLVATGLFMPHRRG